MINILQTLWAKWRPLLGFRGSQDYWQQRYERGGDSGVGSGGESAHCKADTLNAFVEKFGIESIIEFGCGDGRQLELAKYPMYVGYDISHHAINRCRDHFANDASKRFELVAGYDGTQADLCLSLDVLFHLVEDVVYNQYLQTLFAASSNFVVVYSSNEPSPPRTLSHVRHRHVSSDITAMFPDFVNFDPDLPNFWGAKNTSGISMGFLFYRRANV